MAGLDVLDAGCGEGKNAIFLDSLRADVIAIDISHSAISNGRRFWPASNQVSWVVGDISRSPVKRSFDLVVAYGLLHCLPDLRSVKNTVARLQEVTREGGWHIVCSFNDRHQELNEAHEGFQPCLIPHSEFLHMYRNWAVEYESDEDLLETHPHNLIPHQHSMTRLIARKT